MMLRTRCRSFSSRSVSLFPCLRSPRPNFRIISLNGYTTWMNIPLWISKSTIKPTKRILYPIHPPLLPPPIWPQLRRARRAVTLSISIRLYFHFKSCLPPRSIIISTISMLMLIFIIRMITSITVHLLVMVHRFLVMIPLHKFEIIDTYNTKKNTKYTVYRSIV